MRLLEEIGAPAATELLVFGFTRFNDVRTDSVVGKTLKFNARQIIKAKNETQPDGPITRPPLLLIKLFRKSRSLSS